MKKLPRSFYDRDTVLVAKELLGMYLVHRKNGLEQVGKIVEVEAYLGPHDKASHSSRGLTPRTTIMFGPPGYVYMYLVYGMHYCFNVVTEPKGNGTAVLVRALEPVANLPGKTKGPALLCQAMGLDLSHNGVDLCRGDLFIANPGTGPGVSLAARPRIGVDYAGVWAKRLLRFYIKKNPFVSKP